MSSVDGIDCIIWPNSEDNPGMSSEEEDWFEPRLPMEDDKELELRGLLLRLRCLVGEGSF